MQEIHEIHPAKAQQPPQGRDAGMGDQVMPDIFQHLGPPAAQFGGQRRHDLVGQPVGIGQHRFE